MGVSKEVKKLREEAEAGGPVPYDSVKGVVSAAISAQPAEQPDKGIGFAIIQADTSVGHSIQRSMAAEDRGFIRDVLSKITKFYCDQVEALGFLLNTEELIVVTCFEFARHDGGTSNGTAFAQEIKRIRPQAKVFVYEKGQAVTPDDIKGGVVDGLIPANTNDPNDHSALLQFLRNHIVDFRLARIEKTLQL